MIAERFFDPIRVQYPIFARKLNIQHGIQQPLLSTFLSACLPALLLPQPGKVEKRHCLLVSLYFYAWGALLSFRHFHLADHRLLPRRLTSTSRKAPGASSCWRLLSLWM